MRATMYGWLIVCPAPIGSGLSSYASRALLVGHERLARERRPWREDARVLDVAIAELRSTIRARASLVAIRALVHRSGVSSPMGSERDAADGLGVPARRWVPRRRWAPSGRARGGGRARRGAGVTSGVGVGAALNTLPKKLP